MQRLIASRNTMLFRSSAAWGSKNGDKVNKEFFMHKKPRTNCSYNPKLVKEDGSMSEDVSEILEAVTSHYQELLSDNSSSHEQPALIEYVLEGMQHKISDTAQANLSRPLLEEEVADALASICRTSCPGSDGLSRDFFEFFWDVIKADLVDGLKEAWDVGCFPAQF